MNKIRVSVNILTKNRCELLRKCLYSLSKQSYKNFEVVVLDEHSTDGTEEMVSQLSGMLPDLKFIQRTVKGLGYGRNRGVEESTGEIIAFIDDDEEAHPDWLKKGVEVMVESQADIVRGAIYFPDGKPFRELRDDKMQFPTANIFYKKKVIEDVGMFDERFVYGSEDVDLGVRALKKGYKLALCEESITYHCYLPSNPISLLKSAWKVGRFRAANRVLRYKKHSDIFKKELTWGVFYKKTHVITTALFLGMVGSVLNFCTLNSSIIYILSVSPFVISYCLFRVFVDNNFYNYPKRLLAFPYFILMDMIETLYTLKGAIKYRYLML